MVECNKTKCWLISWLVDWLIDWLTGKHDVCYIAARVVVTIFQSFWLLPGLLWPWAAATESVFEVITLKMLRSASWLGWPIGNICVTDNHGYFPSIVVTIMSSFSMSWRFTREIWRMHLTEQRNSIPFQSTPVCVSLSFVFCVVFYQ